MRAAAIITILLMSSACASMGARKAENYLRHGEREERAGRLDRAIALYRRAEAADPKNAEAHRALEAALAKQPQEAPPPPLPEPEKKPSNDPLAVLDRLRGSGEIDAHNGDAFYDLGMQLKAAGKEKQSAVFLQRFVTLEKASPSPRKELLKKAEYALFEMNASDLPE